ncbi:MAG: sigma 54-interacting transcriptional regulator [Nannocystaceae bacterium]
MPSEPLDRLVAWTAAAVRGPSPAAVVRNLSDMLEETASITRLELARREGDVLTCHSIVRGPAGLEPARELRPLDPETAGVLTGEAPRVVDVGATRRRPASARAAQARSDGARWYAITPIADAGESAGALTIWCATAPRWLDAALLQAFGRVLWHVLAAQEVVRRVAAVARRAHDDNRTLREEVARAREDAALVTRSPAMRRALERATAVARHDTPALLTGESGTGKELLARLIHRLSPRRGRPLVQVNCGALPATLVESELFGHERGAFTGASRTHRGLFERADGGTLLLDEVGELPLLAQVKLLRVLQEGTLTRVGGEETRAVDVRILAATHQPLAAMVEDGRFRLDLYYRLAVLPIALPPLRERQEDLPALTAQLLAELCAPKRPPTVPHAVLEALRRHAWPGNVRELRNVLEAAVILGPAGSLQLPPEFAPQSTGAPAPAEDRVETFEAATRRALEQALAACHGKIYGPGGAAERLALHPGTLQSKLRKLGIRREAFVRSGD